MKIENKSLIVDGNALMYRAFHALPILNSTSGIYTNAILGFLNMVTKAIDLFNPTHLIIVFDCGRITFRNDIYSEYKATRKPMPEELRPQMDEIKKISKLMGAEVLCIEGIEADDTIGSLCKSLDGEKIVVSGDKDLLQLIDENTKVALAKKGISEILLVDQDVFTKEYNFKPQAIVDLKSIMGDSSDNIPGVFGIGEKGASDLIREYQTLEGVYENLDKLKDKTKEKLTQHKEIAFLSKTLATIKTDVKLNVDMKACELNLPFKLELTKELLKLNIKSVFKNTRFFRMEDGDNLSMENKLATNLKKEYRVENETVLNSFVKEFDEKEISVLIDDLTLEIATQDDLIKVLVDRNTTKQVCFAGFEQDDFNRKSGQGIILDNALKCLKPIFENQKIKKVVYNYKNIYYRLKKLDIKLKGDWDDILISGWLASKSNIHNLKEFLKAQGQQYSAEGMFNLNKHLMENLTEKEKDIYKDIELPLAKVLIEMEENGFKINEEELESLKDKYQTELDIITDEVYALCNTTFNLNSPKQVAEILFNKLKIESKEHDTGVDTLKSIRHMHPVVDKIIEYREVAKLTSTYLNAFIGILADTKTSFIHTTFNQTGTITGRLSSESPNLQNIPVRTKKGRDIRKVFISRFDGGQIVAADYNQIELRLTASLSKDEKMIAAYKNGVDIHTLTASQIFGLNIKDITKDLRQYAKSVNFGIIYGISAFGLSEQLEITPKEAATYIESYFKNFPKVKKLMDDNIEKCLNNGGYTETLLGRRRKITEIFNVNKRIAEVGKRMAINAPIQGGASDIIKIAMINISKRIKKDNLQAKLVLQVHDELIVDSPKDEVEIVKKILKEEMESVVKLDVKMVADVEVGDNWEDLK